MYKYYIEVEKEEHYLYADEVAEYLWSAHGICSPSGDKPARVLVRDFLSWFHDNEPKLYYNTRNGLKRVYPFAEKAVSLLLDNCKEAEGCVELNGKKYKYVKKLR